MEHNIQKRCLNILDYGCGVGTIDFYLASNGHKVLGLDISNTAIDSCRLSAMAMGLNKSAKFEITGRKLNDKYDLILCSEVIEHVPGDVSLIKRLSKRLKKGGKLLISTPSENAPLFKLGLASNFDKRVGHVRRYNQEKLVKLIDETGLKITKIKLVEGILRNSLFVFPTFGVIVKFLKGPLSDLTETIDSILVKLFGESNIFVIIKKP